jgi:hypothetical protein
MATTQQFIIRITDTALAFAMRCGDGTPVAYEPYAMKRSMSVEANLREAFRTVELLKRAGNRVTALVDSPVLLVPLDEYKAEEMEQQYGFVCTQPAGTVVANTVLPSLDSVAVYAVSKDLRTVLGDHFEEIRILPLMAHMWEFLLQRSFGGTNKKLFAYFHDNVMDVCSFSRGRFLFSNRFSVTDSHDALYYLLGVWKNIGAKAMVDDLFLLGRIPAREALVSDAKEFLRRVYYINPSGDFNRADFTQVDNMPFDMMVAFGTDGVGRSVTAGI